MKKVFAYILSTIIAIHIFAQKDSILAPYKRFPVFPPVTLLKTDSTHFTKADLPKKKPVLLILFNPQCEHCRRETEEITQDIDKFKKVEIIMATTMAYDSMLAFHKQFGLAAYKNITVGRDIHYFLPSFFKISNLPFLAFYNRNKELISVFEGALPIPQIAAMFDKD